MLDSEIDTSALNRALSTVIVLQLLCCQGKPGKHSKYVDKISCLLRAIEQAAKREMALCTIKQSVCRVTKKVSDWVWLT